MGLYKGSNLISPVQIVNSGSGSSEDFSKMIKNTITSAVIPNDVTSIGQYAFYKKSLLTSTTLHNGVTSIGNHAYEDTGLTSVSLNNVTSIGEGAFMNTSLTSVTFSTSATSIGTGAFKNCSSLVTVTNLDSATSIGSEAFYGTALTSISISDACTSIGTNAFGSCASLTSIYIDQNTGSISGAPWGAYNATVTWKDSGGGDEGEDIDTTLGTRIDNKATVVGVTTDENGKRYAVCVVDAAYRSDEAMKWSTQMVNTPLIEHDNETDAKADHHTGKYNTDLILSTYTATDYPAFNFARNACSITIGSNTYYSVLPNLTELQMIYNNKDSLDQYDPTASTYTDRRMSEFTFGAFGAWSSSEYGSGVAWFINNDGDVNNIFKDDTRRFGVCPVIEIPLKD